MLLLNRRPRDAEQ